MAIMRGGSFSWGSSPGLALECFGAAVHCGSAAVGVFCHVLPLVGVAARICSVLLEVGPGCSKRPF